MHINRAVGEKVETFISRFFYSWYVHNMAKEWLAFNWSDYSTGNGETSLYNKLVVDGGRDGERGTIKKYVPVVYPFMNLHDMVWRIIA